MVLPDLPAMARPELSLRLSPHDRVCVPMESPCVSHWPPAQAAACCEALPQNPGFHGPPLNLAAVALGCPPRTRSHPDSHVPSAMWNQEKDRIIHDYTCYI